jgi:hypothetical protein
LIEGTGNDFIHLKRTGVSDWYIGDNTGGFTINNASIAGGDSKLFISSTGLVGIGTTVAEKRLDVSGSIRTRGPVNQAGIEFSDNTPTTKWRIQWDNVSNSLDFNFVG